MHDQAILIDSVCYLQKSNDGTCDFGVSVSENRPAQYKGF